MAQNSVHPNSAKLLSSLLAYVCISQILEKLKYLTWLWNHFLGYERFWVVQSSDTPDKLKKLGKKSKSPKKYEKMSLVMKKLTEPLRQEICDVEFQLKLDS